MSELRVKKIINTSRFILNSVFRKINFKLSLLKDSFLCESFYKILNVKIESFDEFILTLVLLALALPLVQLVQDLKFWVV